MGSVVRYCESSLRNGFGLQYIYHFLNIPFLQLQRESLLQQLQINARDMDASLEEIDVYARSDDNNYDIFLDILANKRRTKQEALSADVLAKAKPLEEAKRLHDEAVQAAALAEQQQQATTSKPLNTIVQVIKKTTETPSATVKPTPTTKQKPPVVAIQPIVQQGDSCFMSNFCFYSYYFQLFQNQLHMMNMMIMLSVNIQQQMIILNHIQRIHW